MNAFAKKPVLPAPPRTTPESARTAPAPRSRRRFLAIPAAVLVVVLMMFTAHWWLSEGQWIETTDDAYVQGHITVLSPRIDGDVKAVLVADNQHVRAGDPLIELDPADWQARLDQADAAVAEADAQIATLMAQIAQQRTNLAALTAMRLHAEAEMIRTRDDAARAATLQAQGWASQQAADLAQAEGRKAGAMLTAATAQEASARDQIGVLTAQSRQAEARARGARAQASLAKDNREHTTIRAPFDGIVGNRAAEPGKHVGPGTQLMALAPLPEELFVTANFKETQLRDMRRGQKVRLIPDIDPNAAVDGRVDSLAPATGALFSLLPPENATGNFTKVVQRIPVKLAIDPAQARRAGWLRAGLSVVAEVDTRGPDAVRLGWWGTALAAFARH